jgi:citrate lyase synthetase
VKKIGVFGGGFKPFTTGHFSKVSLSLEENDVTYLFYGVSSRKKDSDFIYTEKMAERVFEIVRSSLNEKFGNRIIVQKGVPNPLVEIFNLIEKVKNSKDNLDVITVYSGPEDEHRFTKYIGTHLEERYFGNLVKEGRLGFKSSNIETLTRSMKSFYPRLSDRRIQDLITVRGSAVRKAILKNDISAVKSYIPVFLFETNYNGYKASDEILKTLTGG